MHKDSQKPQAYRGYVEDFCEAFMRKRTAQMIIGYTLEIKKYINQSDLKMPKKKKIRLYLDTSIPSAYFDTSKPLRQLITQKWFENEALSYEMYISVIAIEEIDKIKNDVKKQNISELIVKYKMKVLDLSNKAKDLADEYMNKGAIPTSEPEDAYHIAIAVINEIDALASWNFKHIVSINPIRKVHEINKKYNYTDIEIGSLQIFGGAKYGNI